MTCGESEGVLKVLTEFSEATYMAAGSVSGLYRDFSGGGYHQWAWEGDSNLGYHNQLEVIIEAFMKCPVVVSPHCNFIVPVSP